MKTRMNPNSSIANIRAIAKRELSSYFTSPVAYVFLVIFLLLAGFFTFTVGSFFERGEASLSAFFAWHPWIYLVLVPAVGMRVWSEERPPGTMELLLTMPVNPWEAILVKMPGFLPSRRRSGDEGRANADTAWPIRCNATAEPRAADRDHRIEAWHAR